ncbi:MAG: hypothetical protein R3A44_12455 [Caldilineaceae bacterium]
MLTDELVAYIFDGQPHLLAEPVTDWLTASRRYREFVAAFRDKIRKKLRSTPDEPGLLDLQLELETAYLLLQERTLSLVYEPQPSAMGRAPDFAVTYTTSMTFMCEVTRLRAGVAQSEAAQFDETDGAAALPREALRLADAICGKLVQLLPQCSNVLLVYAETLAPTPDELRAILLHIQQRAEGEDAEFLRRHRLRDRADFFRHFQRLSEILVRGSALSTAESPVVWQNPQTKHPLPAKVRTALYRSQDA